MKCPACDVEMELLVAGIFQCPKCKKIVKEKEKKSDIKSDEEELEGGFQDGEFFHKNAGLNKQYEIAEKGITITRTPNRWLAVLLCHSAYLKSDKYVRISWWKKSFSQHAGMFKIYDREVLKNLIMTLEKIEEDFDDFWTWKGKYGKKQMPKTEEMKMKEKKLDIIKYRIIENRTCPICQKKMDKKKSHYECQYCGEIVILEGYNQPIFNVSSSDLDLSFHSNFPINFYLPVSGITIKWLMGEWKALAVIYSKDNPEKKWLRFYWWVRDLRNLLRGHMEIGEGTQLGWKVQRGVSSPNIYNKKEIKPLIEALKQVAIELKWDYENM